MANLSFPADPTVGQTYTPDGLFVIYTWNGEYWEANSVNSFDSRFVELNGDNMTGNLTLGGDKITLNEADGSITAKGSIATAADVIVAPATGLARILFKADATTNPNDYWYSYSSPAHDYILQKGGTPQVTISTGSAEFAGSVEINKGSGASGATNVFKVYGANGSTETASIEAQGSATFAGNVLSGVVDIAQNSKGVINYSDGAIRVQRLSTNGTSFVWQGYRGTLKTSEILAEGSADFAGEIKGERFVTNVGDSVTFYAGESGIDAKSTNSCYLQLLDPVAVKSKFYVQADGSGYFAGTVRPFNVTFNLEADDDTKYTTTTDEDGNESRVYNGAVLDVKERLQKTDAALAALKTAAAAAVDFAALKSAIATALADI